jgi:transposase
LASDWRRPRRVRFAPKFKLQSWELRITHNLAEQFRNRIMQRRWIAMRHEKLAANSLAFVQVASVRLWPRVNEFTPAS